MSGVTQVGSVKFLFNEKGMLLKGAHKIEGVTFCSNQSSGVVAKGFVTITENTDTTAQTATTTVVPVTKKYYTDENGIAFIGFNNINNKNYFFNNDGVMKCSEIIEVDGKKYAFSESGASASGWITIDKNRYLTDSQGVLTYGWAEKEGYKYYLGKDGVMQKGLQTIDEKQYFFNENGVLQADKKIEINGAVYHADEQGVLTLVTPATTKGK